MGWLDQLLRRAAPGDVPADPMAGSVMSPNYVPETSRRQLGLGALRGVLDLTPVGVADAVQSGINNMQSPLGAALRAVVGKSALPGDVALGKLGLLGSGPGYDAGRYAANAAAPMTGLLGNQAGGALPKGYARNQAGAIVWHGSPHKFDKFDASKIGTGEGAQAYGHGLYLAEGQDVAKTYAIPRGVPDVEGLAHERGLTLSRDARIEFMRQANSQRNPTEAARMLQNANREARSLPVEKLADTIQAFRQVGEPQLYKVDLPDDAIARMLDWDKPLSKQPDNVRGAIENLSGVRADKSRIAAFDEALLNALQGGNTSLPKQPIDPLGADLYSRVIGGGNSVAAQKLRNAGIPGIRYLDGGSRGPAVTYDVGAPRKDFGPYSPFTSLDAAKKQLELLRKYGFDDAEIKTIKSPQTSNFVVFPGNEGLLNILERNGQPLR